MTDDANGPDPTDPLDPIVEQTPTQQTPTLDDAALSPTPDPTTVLPVTPAPPTLPAAAPTAAPMIVPSAGPDVYAFTPEEIKRQDMWYRRPGPLAGVVLGLVSLLIIGLIVLAASDDDNAGVVREAEAIRVVLERSTRSGDPIAATITGEVVGPPTIPDAFIWLRPTNALAPNPAIATADSAGEVEFAWAPLESLADPGAWKSSIVLTEELAPNETLAALAFDCILNRDGETVGTVTVAAEIEFADITTARGVSYRFPGLEFRTGDSIRCEIVNGDPNIAPTLPPTTLAPEPTTTLEAVPTTLVTDTTLVALPVTAAPIAETTVPPPTAPPTTTPPATTTTTTTTSTTTTSTTLAPAPASVMTAIDADPALSTFKQFIDVAMLRNTLTNASMKFTVFAPNNDAIEALRRNPKAPDLIDGATVRTFVLQHVHADDAYTLEVLKTLTEVTVEDGPPHAIDATVDPIKIGPARLLRSLGQVANGVVHVVDNTLSPIPK